MAGVCRLSSPSVRAVVRRSDYASCALAFLSFPRRFGTELVSHPGSAPGSSTHSAWGLSLDPPPDVCFDLALVLRPGTHVGKLAGWLVWPSGLCTAVFP